MALFECFTRHSVWWQLPLFKFLMKFHDAAPLSRVQTDATLLDVTCCFRLHTLLHVVGCCCAKFETGHTFSHVQTDATLLANNSQHCWELLRPFARSLKQQHLNGIRPCNTLRRRRVLHGTFSLVKRIGNAFQIYRDLYFSLEIHSHSKIPLENASRYVATNKALFRGFLPTHYSCNKHQLCQSRSLIFLSKTNILFYIKHLSRIQRIQMPVKRKI